MALEENSGFNVSMPVQPMGGYGYGGGYGVPYAVPMYGNYGGGFGGFGGDWSGIIILFLFAAMFGGFGGGFGGNWGMGGFGGFDFPWLLTGQQNVLNGVNANTNAGLNQAATQNTLGDISTAITTGFANAEVASCNRAMDAMQTAYNNQIADLNRSFDSQTAITAGQNAIQSQLAKCCCDNQLQTESLRATVLQENCEDRNQALLNTRDLLTAGVTNTQAVLDAVRGINDKLCDQELQAERRENAELRTQVQMQNLAASQAAQTAALVADNNAQSQLLIQRIAPYPIPAYAVSNPYGCNNYGWNGYGYGYGNLGFNPFGSVGFGNGSF